MNILAKFTTLSALIALLVACESTPDPLRHCETDDRYHTAKESPMTRVPEGYSQPRYRNTTAIPPKKALGKSTLGNCIERPPRGNFAQPTS